MKKTLLTALALGCASALMLTGSAMATSVTTYYADTTYNFLDYDQTNTAESIGTPKVSGMDVSYDDQTGLLSNVTVYMDGRQLFDTLLINDGQDGEWNSWDYYVVDGKDISGEYSTGATYLYEDGLYEVIDGTYETFADAEDSDQTTRVGHINGMEKGLSINTAFSPSWDGSALSYDFTTFAINLNIDDFVIGYVPWCANDVMTTPVPEPATMLLFGTGLVGLVGVSRRRKKQA